MNSVKLYLISYQFTFLDNFVRKLLHEGNSKDVVVVPLPTKKKSFTVLKAPFVNKKAKEQFRLEIHRRLIVLKGQEIKKIPELLKQLSSNNIAVKIVLKGG